MSKGISNSQIENALKNMEDEDINNNSVGALWINLLLMRPWYQEKSENINLSM